MRDLAARLREIVRRESAAPATGSDGAPTTSIRELTYVPDVGGSEAAETLARGVGGIPLDDAGACVMIDRRYDADRSHGRRRIESFAPDGSAPIELFDPRIAAATDWWRRVVFFDIETTGLNGGAGTLAFLVGCGWFEPSGAFLVRQFFLAGPSGERAMLEALARVFDEASLVVSYNGRTFDVPFMEMRWAFHRTAAPTDDLPHFDMLPPARRLWGRRNPARSGAEGCSLSSIERRVLGFHRLNDVSGFEIPSRYFHFLRTGNASAIEGVLEHNRHDLVSLAAVMAHALWMLRDGPEACREPAEQLAIGQVYERAGLHDRAARAYEIAAISEGDRSVQQSAWGRLAALHRRSGRYAESVDAWQRVLDLAPRGGLLTTLERRAAEALAIHHEHRARNLERARRYAEALGAGASGSQRRDVERRLGRLARKIESRGVGRNVQLCYDSDEP